MEGDAAKEKRRDRSERVSLYEDWLYAFILSPSPGLLLVLSLIPHGFHIDHWLYLLCQPVVVLFVFGNLHNVTHSVFL